MRVAWPRLSPAVHITIPSQAGVEGGLQEHRWTLSHSSLGTHRLVTAHLSLIIYSCGIPLRQSICTQFFTCDFSSSLAIFLTKNPFHAPVEKPHVVAFSQVALAIRNQTAVLSASHSCFGVSKY